MMDVTLETINRRLGQIEHLLNAVLEKQDRSTDNTIREVKLSVEQVEDRIVGLLASVFDAWRELWEECEFDKLSDEQKARLLPYLVKVVEQERVWRNNRASSQ